VLLDVHRDPLPHVRILRICAEPHGGRRCFVEPGRDDSDDSPSSECRPGHVGQGGIVAGHDDHPAIEVRVAHVHILQVAR